MNIPQQNEDVRPFLRELTERVNDLANAMRFLNLQDSPTVTVEKTAVGAMMHAAPAAVEGDTGVSIWNP